MKTSEQLNELAAALSKAQSEISHAAFDRKNPHFKSEYASLTSVWNAARGPLTKNGLAVTQVPMFENERFVLVTRLLHSSGQWIESTYPIRSIKEDPQSLGSAVSYAKRYSLTSLVGIPTDADDDGEAAMGREETKKTVEPQASVQKIEAAPAVRPTILDKVTNMAPNPVGAAPIPAQKSWVDAMNERRKAEDIHDPLANYVVTFGKYKGQKLGEVLIHELHQYSEWLKDSAKTKPLKAAQEEFVAKASEFLAQREVAPKKEQTNVDAINDELQSASNSFMNEDVPF